MVTYCHGLMRYISVGVREGFSQGQVASRYIVLMQDKRKKQMKRHEFILELPQQIYP